MDTETTTAEPEREALLDLTALEPERQLVNIRTKEHPDGKMYELRTFADFGIADQQWLSIAGREYQDLWDNPKLNNNQKKRLKYLLDKMTSTVLDAPKEVLNTLSDWEKAQVVLAFTVAPLASAAMEAEDTTDLLTSGS